MIQDIDNINVSIQDDNNVNVTVENDSITVNEGTPTDIAEIMHNEEIRQENEAQRIANEEQRISNEEDREEYIADLKQRVLDGEFDGEDGFSPIANVSKSGATATITITDKNGTTTAEISDGTDGIDGTDGVDGVSPVVSMEKQGKVTTLTITDATGVHTTEIRDGNDGSGTGDMLKATYDTNDNGVVDNAEKVNNHTVNSDVPANAVFTDTTYTAGTGIDITNNVISSTQSSAEWGNITGTLSDQTDLQNALDGKQDKIDSTHKLASDLVDDTNQNNKFLTEGAQQIEGTKTFTSLPQFAFSTEPILDNELTTKAYVDNFEYQKRTMPAASSYYYNDIFQYVGTTNVDYTKGYFYRCTRSGTSGGGYQYEWTRTDVQPGFSGDYNDLANKPTIPDELADLSDDTTHRLVTDTEKSTWNSKSDFSGDYDDLTNKPSIPTIDSSVSTSSTNGVENQAITNYVNDSISGDLVVDSIRTKNIFDGITEQGSYAYADGSKSPSSNYVRSLNKISVEAGKTYTLSYTSSIANNSGFVFFNNGTYVGSQSSGTTVTIPSGANQVVFNLGAWPNNITPSDVSNIQFEEGDTATTYKQYQDLNYKAPVILYDNPSGTQDASITLSDYIGNYEYIELFFRNQWIYGSQKIFVNKSNITKSFPLNIIYGSGTADITFMVNVYTIINNSLTMTESGNRAMSGTIKNNNVVSLSKQNQIWLTRVVGYK